MSEITIICFAVAAISLVGMYFTGNNRGSERTGSTVIGFIASLLIFVAGGVVTYINGWKWLLIYIAFIFLVGPLIYLRKVKNQ